MKNRNFVGIDVSKEYIDLCLIQGGQILVELRVSNTKKAISAASKDLCSRFGLKGSNTLCCMEHTGIYNNHLLEILYKCEFTIWLERALQIKLSMGAVRGKTDKLDAVRIAEYASRHQDKCIPWKPERSVIKTLKVLISLRARLQRTVHQLIVPLSEAKKFMDKPTYTALEQLSKTALTAAQKSLEKLEEKILLAVTQDANVNHLYKLLQTIDGVGPVIALKMIVTTNEFQNHRDPRRFACYAGVVPFEHSSGKSVRKRSRISHMANKSVKTLLTMGARSVVNINGELKNYYLRKVEEGKNERSVLNAVRNKLIGRIFAVVKRNEPYQKNFYPCVA